MTSGANLSHSIPAAVVGVGGYTGVELAATLAGHPVLEVVGLFGSADRAGSRPVGEVDPRLRGVLDLPVEPGTPEAVAGCGARVVFLATPHAVSADLAPLLLEAGITVIDLSGAFRLKDEAVHLKHYGFARNAGLVERAVYGLPEVTREGLAGAALVACAGCYVTAATVPLAALARAGVIAPGTRPIVDAVSGVSGAGRHAGAEMSFCEVSAKPYGVLRHRHHPEIEAYSGTRVVFQPHLGAYDRGILATIHVELAPGVTAARVREVFASALGHEPMVRLLPLGVWPSVGAVARTNFIDIAWAVDEGSGVGGGHLIVFSALDNLLKGASAQAVQCANAALGIEETAGLLPERKGVPA